ncbi:DDE-type integrase/transposase/recombinase, partial [Enterobacter hormaechei subsp. xiangfangensis]|uniref:DDE-type integrase/transposase/recombinase n=1 Tax=Enterobacter hormaechei TaxID=158836 RepID=UPI0039BFAAFA
DVEHRQIKYRNNVIECDHGKLKRIINATLGFKSMKTAYATIKGIEVMRALRMWIAGPSMVGDFHPLISNRSPGAHCMHMGLPRSWWEGSERHIQLSVVEHHPQ